MDLEVEKGKRKENDYRFLLYQTTQISDLKTYKKLKKTLTCLLVLVENLDFPMDIRTFCDIGREKMWDAFNKISIFDKISTKAIVFHAFSQAIGGGKKKTY